MNIVVCVKQVPDTGAERNLRAEDARLDRASADGLMNELDEYAIEEGLRLTETHGGEGRLYQVVAVVGLPVDRDRAAVDIHLARQRELRAAEALGQHGGEGTPGRCPAGAFGRLNGARGR